MFVLGVSDTGTGMSMRCASTPSNLLHHQGCRPRHRAWPQPVLRLCAAIRRHPGDRFHRGRWHRRSGFFCRRWPPRKSRPKWAINRTVLLVDDESRSARWWAKCCAASAIRCWRRKTRLTPCNSCRPMPDRLSLHRHYHANGINGLELLEEARSIRPGLPALLASRLPRDVLRNIAQLQDDVMFLAKTYTIGKPAAHIKPPSGRPVQ